jgi:hypothetical protein
VSYYLGLNFLSKRGKRNNTRLMQEKTQLKKLNIDKLCQSFIKANKCAIFLDIETLPHL